MICKISGLSVNTLPASDNYSLLNREKVTQPIQKQLPQKIKDFCQFFSTFLKSKSNFEYFEKKDDPHSLCISEIRDCETHGYRFFDHCQ